MSTTTLPIICHEESSNCRNLQGVDLINHLIKEQQELTAVEKFARSGVDCLCVSESCESVDDEPAQSKFYRSLLPASAPGEGEQYAFQVDLDRCSGCKACVTACHSLNGLDDDESWRDVGLLIGGVSSAPVMQHVTSACHHCVDPACLNVCPTNSYEKDPSTGIVHHHDDQCFGCQYCILACPYDVPKYNSRLGIVRKCDMCSNRLAGNEAPACVQACPHEAISIKVERTQQIIDDSEANLFLAGAPQPQYTLPSTNYKSEKPLPRNVLPADYYTVKPEHAHWPLVVMLVLTQLSVGAFVTDFFWRWYLGERIVGSVQTVHSINAVLFGLLALAASTLHLGRPLLAFRAVVGLKHSWLSREIVMFGLFAGLAISYAGSMWIGGRPEAQSAEPVRWLGSAVLATGLAGVCCSIKIYQVTQRPFWNGFDTSVRFLLTTLLLGTSATWLSLMLVVVVSGSNEARALAHQSGSQLAQLMIGLALTKLLFELSLFRHRARRVNHPLKRSAQLMSGALGGVTLARFGCGFLGGVWMPAFLLMDNAFHQEEGAGDLFLAVVVGAMFLACLFGELLERYTFFAAVVAPRMPRGLTP